MLPVDGQPVLPAADVPAVAPAASGVPRGAENIFVFHDPCVLGTRLNLAVMAGAQAEA